MYLTDAKTPLYRYLSFKYFNQMLFSKELTLISPGRWPDKYELYWLKLFDTETGRTQLETYVKNQNNDTAKYIHQIQNLHTFVYNTSYCLCFSKAKDAEVLWNARSDNNKGIMFATTAGKLRTILPECTIQEIDYDLENIKTGDHLHQYSLFPEGTVLNDPEQLLLHKRACFKYEQEVRLILTSDEKSELGLMKRPIPDIHSFIDGVMVHPCADKEYTQLINLLCEHFNIPFWGKSKIYEFAPIY